MNLLLESACAVAAVAISLALRPWRLLAPAIATPLLATLCVLPWLWALPWLAQMPLRLQWSGAVLVALMFGWPLAVPLLAIVALAAWLLAPIDFAAAVSMFTWQGVVPATFTALLGAAFGRWLPAHLFVYILGRGFLGAVACLFLASLLAQAAGHGLPGIERGLGNVARWLTAWGDGFVTGMLTAVFVAFRPQWLLTWSDRRAGIAPPGAR